MTKTTINFYFSAAFNLVYQLEYEYIQNCQIFANQINYIGIDNCQDFTIGDISQSNTMTFQTTCIQNIDSPSFEVLEVNLTKIATELATIIATAFIDTIYSSSISCPDDPWYSTTESNCSYTYVLNMCMNIVFAIHYSLQQKCFYVASQSNVVSCEDGDEGLSLANVDQSNFYDQANLCASSSVSVQEAIEDLEYWLEENKSQLQDSDDDLFITIVVISILYFILMLMLIPCRHDDMVWICFIAWGIALGLSIWFFIGYFEHWYPYLNAITSPDYLKWNQQLFVLNMFLVAFLLFIYFIFFSYIITNKINL